MKTIIISPFSKTKPGGGASVKNYPYWRELIELLHKENYYVIQIGKSGEPLLGADKEILDASLKELADLILPPEVIPISVDNFFPHLCWASNKKCIVIFSKSDPLLFGHVENINLLKDRSYLRRLQYDVWYNEQVDPNSYIFPEVVMEAIHNYV